MWAAVLLVLMLWNSLQQRNAEISIVEMMDQIGRDLDPVTKNDMKDQMKKHHVAQLTKTALQEVKTALSL